MDGYSTAEVPRRCLTTVDGATSHDIGEAALTLEDETARDEFTSHRMRDVLDRETIDQIEELHGAVVRAEAEQRFGLLRGKRTRQVAEAEAAEHAYLNQNGFATYNDFRLRIRRSTALHGEESSEEMVAWDDNDFDGELEPVGGFGTDSERAEEFDSPGPFDAEPDSDSGADAAPDDHEVSQEGSEQMGPLPDSAPAPSAPPVPSFAPRGDVDSSPTAAPDFRRLTEPLFATLQAETDRFVAARLETAEKQAAEIVNRASREAAEIIGRAARMHDAVKSLVDDVTRQSETFLNATADLPTEIERVRDGVAADLEALRNLAENAPAKATPAPEPPSAWVPPPRVAPPPPMSVAAPASD